MTTDVDGCAVDAAGSLTDSGRVRSRGVEDILERDHCQRAGPFSDGEQIDQENPGEVSGVSMIHHRFVG